LPSSSTLTTEKDRSSSSTRIKKSEESGGLSEKIDRKGERERRKEATEVIENLNLRSLETKTGRSRSASGREEVRKKEEDTMAVIRENIYLRKPGLEAWPGPPVPSASASWLSSSASPSSPSATLPTMCRSKGDNQGGRGHLSGQVTNIAIGTLHGEGNCTTAATSCCVSGTTFEREDDPGVDTDLQWPMGAQNILLI
jgi:hypothetical protein